MATDNYVQRWVVRWIDPKTGSQTSRCYSLDREAQAREKFRSIPASLSPDIRKSWLGGTPFMERI